MYFMIDYYFKYKLFIFNKFNDNEKNFTYLYYTDIVYNY